jgi:hypothetical protein
MILANERQCQVILLFTEKILRFNLVLSLTGVCLREVQVVLPPKKQEKN